MESDGLTVNDLKNYLRQRRSARSRVLIPEFEDFLKDVSDLFALRMAAEEHWSGSPKDSVFGYDDHRHEAQSVRGALPLEWANIKQILAPAEDGPRTTLIGFIAAHCAEAVRSISSGLRRVLSRERVGTPIGKVQQLDTYCMRWLMRQPGRSFEEKAGTRQRVMAVVRREHYDTLENRVFKDFLVRAENMADSYLEEIRPNFEHHKVFDVVRRFKLSCQGALTLPEMDLISSLAYLPQPNYVLQQDNHYSKIWIAYCRIVKLSTLAEKLWGGRGEVKRRLGALRKESMWQYENGENLWTRTMPWIRPLNGDSVFTEFTSLNHTFARTDMLARRAERRRVSPREGCVGVVDLTGTHTWGDDLVLGGFHENAMPRIDDATFPLFDDTPVACRFIGLPLEKASVHVPIGDIFSDLNSASAQNESTEKFARAKENAGRYCARLYGEYRFLPGAGRLDEMVVLSPDDWNAVTQEIVIRAFPALDRRKVHLLWRSVATVLGMDAAIQTMVKNGETVAVVDFRNDGSVLVSCLKYLMDDESGRLVPQRAVFTSNGKLNTRRYALYLKSGGAEVLNCPLVTDSSLVCVTGAISESFHTQIAARTNSSRVVMDERVLRRELQSKTGVLPLLEDAGGFWSQRDGAVLFCCEHTRRTLYFDELEPMWIVGQDEIHEKIVREALVTGEDKFPGGASKKIKVKDGRLCIGEGQRGVEFLFHIGDLTDHTPLHQYQQELTEEKVRERLPLDVEVEVSPGQGMALTRVMAPIFKQPILLDYLNNMKQSSKTIAKMGDELKRSFPPTSAIVEALPETYDSFFRGADQTNTAQIKAFLEDRLKFSELPSRNCLFYSARRKTENDLRAGESRLHLLDRYNVFGNVPGALRPRWMTEDQERLLFKKVVAGLKDDRSKALRLIAWTYRGGNEDIAKVARNIFSLWERGKSPTVAGEMKLWKSLLGNLLACEELKDLLPAFIKRFIRIGQLSGWDYDELRMFYYLLQFDEAFCFHAQLDVQNANLIAQILCMCLGRYRKGHNANTYDAALRSLLYLLRMREKERSFLRDYSIFRGAAPKNSSLAATMQGTFFAIKAELDKHMEDERPATRTLRTVTQNFLNGSGTLPDVISIARGE